MAEVASEHRSPTRSLSSTASAGVSGSETHQGIARDIGLQVETMILQAKHANEVKVGKEIQRTKIKMEQLREKIKMVSERLARLESSQSCMTKVDFQASLTKLEGVWESEVAMLKHELWQTIQAHNHNADLLKHHKDAIDQVVARVKEAPEASPDFLQACSRLAAMENALLKEQTKEQRVEEIMQRVQILQSQVQLLSAPSWPGVGMTPFAQASALAAATAGTSMTGLPPGISAPKKGSRKDDPASKKGAKAAPKKPPGLAGGNASTQAAAAAAAASLRAEAPEFVPTAPGLSDLSS